MIHVLKCWPVSFEPIINGFKTFEVRKNDRPYNVGDTLILREFEPCYKCNGSGKVRTAYGRPDSVESCDVCGDYYGIYGNRYCKCLVAHIMQGGQFGIEQGYIVMSIVYMAFGVGDWQENERKASAKNKGVHTITHG